NTLPLNRAWILLLGDEGAGSHHWLIDSAGLTQFGVWGGGQVQPELSLGVWNHVVITHNGTFVRGYVNGFYFENDPATFNLQGIPLTLAKNYVGENFFNGTIDHVRIYNKSLNQEQVRFLYNNGRN
ncbi:MAG: LamG domain-containing protein, partial [Candidatus Aenigmarchaeota archaeon]|nr:LamG domain-containing protein [Candidatus Aenigmarchaeota archaeon]